MTLEEQVLILIAENAQLKGIIKELEANIIQQGKIISQQNNRIAELERLLHKATLLKDSSNSSKPPSTDISTPKRNQSLREKSGKKSGGQIGHQGTTLKQVSNPDEIVKIEPHYCKDCGCSLDNIEPHIHSKRQVIDIPPVKPIVTEYQNYSKKCPRCGKSQTSSYPDNVTNHIQYGDNINSFVAYCSVYQYIPYKRLKELFKHLFNLEISQGSVDNILERMSNKSTSIYERIHTEISTSSNVGADETSAKVNGKKWWFWVWQNIESTFISASSSRGSKTIEALFPDGFEHSILNSDRWGAHLKTNCKGHQLCTAHLLRDIQYLEELEKNEWSHRIKSLLLEGLELKRQESKYNQEDKRVLRLEGLLDLLLTEEIPKSDYPKTSTFQRALKKHRNKIFTYLYYKDVPPDNNGSERAICNAKVKQKVSGQFKSGQNRFCILRSVIDTCLKRGVDIMFALNGISKFAPTG